MSLRLSLLCLASLTVVLFGALCLDAGVWTREEIRAPPFMQWTDQGKAVWVPLGQKIPLFPLLETGGDSNSDPSGSDLRAWLDGIELGPSHTMHATIDTEGGGAFSHWHDTLVFSVPEGQSGDRPAVLRVRYPVRLNPMAETAAWVGWLIAVLVCLRQAQRRGHASYGTRFLLAIKWTSAVVVTVLAATGAFWLVCVALAAAREDPYPLLTGSSSWLFRGVAQHRAWIAHAMLLASAVGALAAWAGWLTKTAAPTEAASDRYLIRWWVRIGWVLAIACLCFPLAANQAGYLQPDNIAGFAVAGVVPLQDTSNYAFDTLDQSVNGIWTYFSARRPLAAATRTAAMLLSGFSLPRFVLVQALLLGLAAHLASSAVARWKGPWAGVASLALFVTLLTPYVATHSTEPWGIFWALIGTALLLSGLQSARIADQALGLFFVTFGLLARMGSMFTAPAIAVWLCLVHWRGRSDRLKAVASVAAVIAVSLGLNELLAVSYSGKDASTAASFAYSFCGLAHGTDQGDCLQRYDKELKQQGDKPEGTFLYQKGWEKFTQQPDLMLGRLWEAAREFTPLLPDFMVSGRPSNHRLLGWVPTTYWLALALIGIAATRRWSGGFAENSFLIAIVAGILLSGPFVYFDDGWRTIVVGVVPAAAVLASGMATPVAPGVVPGRSWSRAGSAFAIIAIASLALAPWLAYRLDPLEVRRERQMYQAQVGDRVEVLGGPHLAGFVVYPDGRKPEGAAGIEWKSFQKAAELSHLESWYRAKLSPDMGQNPFGLIWAYSPGSLGAYANPRAGASFARLYVVPAQVVLDRSTERWLLSLENADVDSGRWFRVTSAQPLQRRCC